jgi:hypothetical protein
VISLDHGGAQPEQSGKVGDVIGAPTDTTAATVLEEPVTPDRGPSPDTPPPAGASTFAKVYFIMLYAAPLLMPVIGILLWIFVGWKAALTMFLLALPTGIAIGAHLHEFFLLDFAGIFVWNLLTGLAYAWLAPSSPLWARVLFIWVGAAVGWAPVRRSRVVSPPYHTRAEMESALAVGAFVAYALGFGIASAIRRVT